MLGIWQSVLEENKGLFLSGCAIQGPGEILLLQVTFFFFLNHPFHMEAFLVLIFKGFEQLLIFLILAEQKVINVFSFMH